MAKTSKVNKFDPKKADRNKDGQIDDWEQRIGEKIAGAKTAKKAAKKTKTKKKKVMKESTCVSNFVTAISNKNYAQATKYLTYIANMKLKAKIGNAINEPLF